MNRTSALLALATLAAASPAVGSSVIWDGPRITFEKTSFSDPSQPENQDRITDDIWITRNVTQGLYNAAVETFQGTDSPAGTAWAVGTTAELGTLTFDTWLNTFGLGTVINGPPNAVGEDFVLHLIDDDIYIDLQITAWGIGSGAGGSFAYSRTTAVPEPATLGLVATALAPLARRRRR